MPVDPRIQAALNAPLKGKPSLAHTGPAKPPRGPRGYAAAPGSGPSGKTCFYCRFAVPTSSTERNHICSRAKKGPLGPLFIRLATSACAVFEGDDA